MIAGHLQIKNDYYYMVLSYLDANGKRKQPWFPTGLPIKNNKKRAEKMLLELRQTYVPPAEHKSNGELSADMLFADFMELWLEVVRNSIEKTTFSSYTQMVKGKIAPYFRKTGVKLGELQARHIQSFYLYELKTVSASTVIHEHANIHKALKYAVKMDLIPYNPADKVERPKKQKYIADYYRLEELEQLFEATKDHPYSLLIQITAFYGLRRSEALGLRWDAIDFERNTITIRHIVTNAKIDGKYEIVREDRAKTKSSLRSLPLVDNIREKLLALKEQQKENKRICGNCYNREYDGYVFVDVMGNIFNPRNLSSNFSKLLELKGLRHIRFHDLRHSCASLLLANDVPMKQIQEWLGHSDISTTANIYSHLDYKSKLMSANVMDNVMTLPESWLNFQNFIDAFNRANMGRAYLNSAIILVFVLLGSVLVGTQLAYVLNRFKFPGNGLIRSLFLFATLLPGIAMQVSVYQIMSNLGFINHLYGYIIMSMGTYDIAWLNC